MQDRDHTTCELMSEPMNYKGSFPENEGDSTTETIVLDYLFSEKDPVSGSFAVEEERRESFRKLLQSLPIPAVLIDRSHRMVLPNRSFETICREYQSLEDAPLGSLFHREEDSAAVAELVSTVFTTRKPETWEGVLQIDSCQIWGRMHLRPLRMGKEQFVFVLMEDLTQERKRFVRNKRHAKDLSKARDERERRVDERTHEINTINELLRKEIKERRRAERALKSANEGLEERVEERTAELVKANENLVQEIEQRRRAEVNLQKSKETIEALFNATTDLAFLVDTQGRLLAFNQPFSDTLGKSYDELLGTEVCKYLPKDLKNLGAIRFRKVLQSGEAVRFKGNYYDRTFDNSLYPLLDNNGNVEGVAIFTRDVTEKKQAEDKLNLAAKIIESSSEAVMITDLNASIVDVNRAMEEMTGYSREELIGKNPSVMKSGRHPDEFYKQMWEDMRKKGHWRGEVWDRRKSGETYPKLLSISAVRNNDQEVTHYVGIFTDITSFKETEARLQHLAHFDPLTGLPNRLLFRDRYRQALAESERNNRMVALLLLDLDGFKNVNDTLGHKAGDDLLDAVGKRITRCVRKMDTVARLGGDEFTVVVPDVPDTHSAAVVGRKIVHSMSEPFQLTGREISVTASIGITMAPVDGSNIDRLLQNADLALYHAKQSGKNNFKFFSEKMNQEVVERLEMEADLRKAIERNEFLLYYQPRLQCSTGTVTGVEALLRWKHPRHGLLAPLRFLPLAGDTGLILPIGEWVLRTATRQSKEWQKMGTPPVPVAVNLSALELRQTGLVDNIVKILKEADLAPGLLEIELSESVAMSDPETNVKLFHELKSQGIGISIDNFGTGYSSLRYLKLLPIDTLKSDRSFIADVASDPSAQAIVSATIAVAHNLNLKVTAQGVETEEQLQFLHSQGCDEWQGYYFSPPRPAKEIPNLIGAG